MKKHLVLALVTVSFVGLAPASARSFDATTASAAAAPAAVLETKATPEASATFKAKPILHRPNYTYYKGNKKRGFFSFLRFGK